MWIIIPSAKLIEHLIFYYHALIIMYTFQATFKMIWNEEKRRTVCVTSLSASFVFNPVFKVIYFCGRWRFNEKSPSNPPSKCRQLRRRDTRRTERPIILSLHKVQDTKSPLKIGLRKLIWQENQLIPSVMQLCV